MEKEGSDWHAGQRATDQGGGASSRELTWLERKTMKRGWGWATLGGDRAEQLELASEMGAGCLVEMGIGRC